MTDFRSSRLMRELVAEAEASRKAAARNAAGTASATPVRDLTAIESAPPTPPDELDDRDDYASCDG